MGEYGRQFRLQVPLDASRIHDVKSDEAVRVAIQPQRGHICSETVRFDGKGPSRRP